MVVPIQDLRVHAFQIPTESVESDGTAEWDATTMVLVEALAGDSVGLGYTYSHASAAMLAADLLAPRLRGADAMQTKQCWDRMLVAARNVGTQSVSAAAISAVDNALWDLKARLLGLPLADLLPGGTARVPVYGSGGFSSYSDRELQDQFTGWVERGFTMVKMKVGRQPERDLDRVEAARLAIGDDVDLFVDANGALSTKQALWFADAFADYGVSWFEEPVSSDDLEGLRLLRERAPSGMEIAAGEYGWDPFYFRRMLDAGAVDVLQADATRCAGITGFMAAGTLSESYGIDLSAHTAQNLHVHACSGLSRIRHLEYFHDHARIESLFFEGALEPDEGLMQPDRSRPGNGLHLKWQDAEPYRIAGTMPDRNPTPTG